MLLVERVDAAAPVADVDAPVGEERRRLGRPDPRPPADLPEAGRERDHLALEPSRLRLAVAGRAVHERLEDGVLADGGRGGDAAADALLPRPLPGLRVDGEHDARVVREVEAPVADHRRELEQLPRPERPDAAERRLQLGRPDAVALRAVAEERPGDAERVLGGRRRRGLLLLGRDELLGRGAAHVGGLVALVDDVADDDASGQQDQRGQRRDPLLHRFCLRLDRPHARVAVQEQPAPVAGDGHVLAVREPEHDAAAPRVDAGDAAPRRARVGDAGDDDRGARDRAARATRSRARGRSSPRPSRGARCRSRRRPVPPRPRARSRRSRPCRRARGSGRTSRTRSGCCRSTRGRRRGPPRPPASRRRGR